MLLDDFRTLCDLLLVANTDLRLNEKHTDNGPNENIWFL